MTIKELYEWAVQNNLENYDLVLHTSTGESNSCYSEGDFIVDNDLKEITL